MQEEYKYSDITKKIIGCAMRVHNYLGPGFSEVIYEKCLIIELQKCSLKCERQIVRNIYYDGIYVGNKRLDVVVEDVVLVELKALSFLDNSCFSKTINYLNVFKIDVGLLLNFGAGSLQFKRFANSKNQK